MNNVIVIVGPTAVGKTKLSIDLAKVFRSEIISGDSMQVYQSMDIGTGKVTATEKAGIPHYMIDIKRPDEPFSAAEYQVLVQTYIQEINQKNHIPILVGGSGLYIQSVLYDYDFSNRKRNIEITKMLEKRLKEEGIDVLYEELNHIDKEQAEKIHPNNYRRVIRALEVYESTGLTMSEYHKQQTTSPNYNHFIIGLEMDRKTLYNQINNRVDSMIQQGLIHEVEHLYKQGYADCQSMKAIGYKEIILYLKGEIDLDTAIETLKRNSRRYAKRQYTWFKNKMDIKWYTISPEGNNPLPEIIQDVEQFFSETYNKLCYKRS